MYVSICVCSIAAAQNPDYIVSLYINYFISVLALPQNKKKRK